MILKRLFTLQQLVLIIVAFSGCTTYRNAAHPYSLAPTESSQDWTPPEEILSQLTSEELNLP